MSKKFKLKLSQEDAVKLRDLVGKTGGSTLGCLYNELADFCDKKEIGQNCYSDKWEIDCNGIIFHRDDPYYDRGSW